ncbi:IAA-alanine resistance protein 1 [Linum grandiflorum]
MIGVTVASSSIDVEQISGGQHSHSHEDLSHDHSGHEHVQAHSHSLEDLSVGLSILAGIVVFLLVEKAVRYVEDNSSGAGVWGHTHHHHHHKSNTKLKDDEDGHENTVSTNSHGTEEASDEISAGMSNGNKPSEQETLIHRRKGKGEESDVAAVDSSKAIKPSEEEKEVAKSPSNLVFGYLNLFSDGVHNFTDGMALGSAFLLYGSVGGWSRTLFLLAHELPQEVGDFGILVRSGFSVSKALFFNFLSALLALVGTALALMWGKDPGQSSLIEGFTAGGFIYISAAGVLAEMNNGSSTTLKSTAVQVTSLVLGMSVALCISLVE